MRCLVLGLALVASRVAVAGDPKFEFGKKEELKDVKDVEWHATAEGGLVLTTGNSETTTASGGFKVSRKTGANKLAIEGTGTYAKSGVRVLADLNGNGMIDGPDEIATVDTVTAETLFGKARYDRFLTDFNSLFVAALASRDVPAGKLSAFGGQAGYSRRLLKTQFAETVAEFGFDFSREHLATGSPVSIFSLRGFVGHKVTMTEGTDLDSALEVLTNLNHETLPTGKNGNAFNDTRVNMKLAISSKIGTNLSFQTSFEVHYDNRPGPLPIKNLAMGFVPEADPLDTILKASLIYTFIGANK